MSMVCRRAVVGRHRRRCQPGTGLRDELPRLPRRGRRGRAGQSAAAGAHAGAVHAQHRGSQLRVARPGSVQVDAQRYAIGLGAELDRWRLRPRSTARVRAAVQRAGSRGNAPHAHGLGAGHATTGAEGTCGIRLRAVGGLLTMSRRAGESTTLAKALAGAAPIAGSATGNDMLSGLKSLGRPYFRHGTLIARIMIRGDSMMRANNDNDSRRMHRSLRARVWRVLAWALLPLPMYWAPMVAAADDSPPAAAEAGQLQEIVVTSTRREENLSKVPISVTALTQEDMDTKGIKDITDVVRFTPGIAIDNSGTNNISIRGISSTGGAGTTGIYIDDTPIQIRGLAFS